MAIVLETKNFIIEAPEKPHIDKLDGSHLKITPKVSVADRTHLSPELAKELMKLSMITGEALKTVLGAQGIIIERINYQENGNWKPVMHEHIYGRATAAKRQPFGEALYFPKPETGFYDNNQPLTSADILAIKKELERLLQTDKYKNF